MLGYPEQAVKITDAAHAHARRCGHPFDVGWALYLGAQVFDYLREPDELLKRVEEADRVGRESSLPMLTECWVPICSGTALMRKGQVSEGMALFERGLAVWEESGGRVHSPYRKSVLAEGMAQFGDLAGALNLIDEAIAQVERPGWDERCHQAEILRVKGWLLVRKGDPAAAERAYLASLDWARQQKAKSWELRTATSYARLMRNQGRARIPRPARSDLRLVHRRLRDEGPEGSQGAAAGTRNRRCAKAMGARLKFNQKSMSLQWLSPPQTGRNPGHLRHGGDAEYWQRWVTLRVLLRVASISICRQAGQAHRAGSTSDPLPREAMMDVTEWLRSLGLEQYAPAFAQNHIRPELLPSLAADDLKELGIASVGHRRELLAAIDGLRAGPAATVHVSAPEPAAGSAAERRQLTVMFCDLVGSTAMAARLDPEELREVIGAYRRCAAEAVRRFDGLVAKYMGDGALVYFGFPRAHEDDAVRAALDIVAAVERLDAPGIGTLQVRIGMATGLALGRGDGDRRDRAFVIGLRPEQGRGEIVLGQFFLGCTPAFRNPRHRDARPVIDARYLAPSPLVFGAADRRRSRSRAAACRRSSPDTTANRRAPCRRARIVIVALEAPARTSMAAVFFVTPSTTRV
jgi:hypothetical protein